MHDARFDSPETAWFWYLTARRMIQERGGGKGGYSVAPITVLDMDTVLVKLYRRRKITDRHLAVGRKYHAENRTPDPDYPTERDDARLWNELMDALRPHLAAMDAIDAAR